MYRSHWFFIQTIGHVPDKVTFSALLLSMLLNKLGDILLHELLAKYLQL